MAYCPICKRKFDDNRGLHGHVRFKHRYELEKDRPARETPLIRAIGQNIEKWMSGYAEMKKEEERREEERKEEKKREEEVKEREEGKYVKKVDLEEERGKKEGKKKKGKQKLNFSDVPPKSDDEAIERYIDEVPDIFVDKYEKYLNTHKEDDELTRRYPDDFERSVRVLPMEKEGKRYLRTVTTDNKKTEDFHRFLKEGQFRFENDKIEGVERERVIGMLRRRIRERLK